MAGLEYLCAFCGEEGWSDVGLRACKRPRMKWHLPFGFIERSEELRHSHGRHVWGLFLVGLERSGFNNT